nr:reverse transcriptase domain-containing protein [Tanacetum cinerariifolium]
IVGDGFVSDLKSQFTLVHINQSSTGLYYLSRIKGTWGSGSKSTTTKSAGKWNIPTFTLTSFAIPTGLDSVRSANSRVMQVGVSSGNQTESKPVGIAKDVKVKLGMFHFPADFVVVDFEPDPPSSLNSRVVFLKDQSSSDRCAQGLTPSDDLIVSTTSLALTPFRDSDFLLFEEADAFLGLKDDLDSPELDLSYYDPEGDILSLEVILNSDPSPHLPS